MLKRSRNTRAEGLRAKGANILKDRSINMSDFLGVLPPPSENPQLHRSTKTQMHKTSMISEVTKRFDHASNIRSEGLGRLHVEIRQELIDKLLNEVFQRKRNPMNKGREATKRSVIEDALEDYFNRKGGQINQEGYHDTEDKDS